MTPAWRDRVARAACIVPAVAAVVGYVLLTARYAVNVVFWDAWGMVPLLQALRTGTLDLDHLWTQHTNNRMVLPRLVDLAIGSWFSFDARVTMLCSVLLLATATLLIMATQRRLQSGPIYLYGPVAFFLFSTVQWENALWSFQVAFYLVLAAFAGAAYAVCRSRGWPWFALAVVLAVAASMSLLQGFFVWPSIALLLWCDRRSRAQLGVWASAGAVTAIVYFASFKFQDNPGGFEYVIDHPLDAVRYFLVLLGSFSRAPEGITEGLGLLMLGLAVWVLARFWLSDRRLPDALPAALVVFTLLCDVTTTIGRVSLGPRQALASRYTTFNLLLFVAAYLSLVDGRRWRALDQWRGPLRAGAAAIALALVFLLTVSSATAARWEASRFSADRRRSADVLLNYETASRTDVQTLLCPAVCKDLVPLGARFLEEEQLSVFADD